MKKNIVKEKSYAFALRIINLYKYLSSEKKEYTMSRQILKSGTSIGANIEEAVGAQSTKDFYAKLTIAYKETRETHYWLRLLKDSAYLKSKLAVSLIDDCEELLKIITAIQKTTKEKQKDNSN